MNNYLLTDLQEYFEEIVHIRKRLLISTSFSETRASQLVDEEDKDDRHLFSGITDYRDLTLLSQQENMYSPTFSYELWKSDLPEELENMNSEYSCYAVAQSYEVFETFLLDIISNYLSQNPVHIAVLKKYSGSTTDKVSIRKALNTAINKDKNNSGLLLIIRQLSTYFTTYEANNIHQVNISAWFDLLSAVRHNLVHSRQALTTTLKQYINGKRHQQFFNQHFSTRMIRKKEVIYLTTEKALDIISWLSSFSHLIFKSLSQEKQLDLHVPQYRPALRSR